MVLSVSFDEDDKAKKKNNNVKQTKIKWTGTLLA